MALSEVFLRRSRDLWIRRERTYKRKAVHAHTMHKRRSEQIAAAHAAHAKQLWHPDATHDVYADAGAFTTGKPKLVWHTTEGSSLPTYQGSAPHFTLDPRTGKLWQHIPVNRAAKSLKHPAGTVETNHAHALQVELIGFARDTAAWPDAHYARIAELARWIEHNADVPRTCGVKFFTGTARLGGQAWLDYSGHCGHCHVPNNDHIDPGSFQIGKVLG
jgi:hypothetical protein